MRCLPAFSGMINSFALIYSRRNVSICKTFVERREKSWIAWINYARVDSFIHFRRVSPCLLSTTHLEQVCKWAFHTETSFEAFLSSGNELPSLYIFMRVAFNTSHLSDKMTTASPRRCEIWRRKGKEKQKAHNGIRRNMASKIVLTSSEARCGRGGIYSRLAVAIVTGARSVFEEYLLLMTY